MNGTTSNDKRQVEHGGQAYLGALLLAMSVGAPFFVLIRQSGRVVDVLPLSDWSAIPPFGTVGVVFVHVVATFALSWVVARTIRRFLGHATVLRTGFFAILAGSLAVQSVTCPRQAAGYPNNLMPLSILHSQRLRFLNISSLFI